MSTENQTTGNVNLKKQDLSQLVNMCVLHVFSFGIAAYDFLQMSNRDKFNQNSMVHNLIECMIDIFGKKICS